MYRNRVILAAVTTALALGAGLVLVTTARAATNSYEAEARSNTLSGGARVARCPACSGGAKVGFVGKTGTLRFTGVQAAASGTATPHISYARGTARGAQLTVDGGPAVTLAFPPTGGFGTPGKLDVSVQLAAGSNTVTFANPSDWAPDFDRIVVDPATGPSDSPSPTPTPTPTPP